MALAAFAAQLAILVHDNQTRVQNARSQTPKGGSVEEERGGAVGGGGAGDFACSSLASMRRFATPTYCEASSCFGEISLTQKHF